jgi:hypothetical protein
VILNPKDELVSPGGVRDWIAARQLQPAWGVQEINPKPSERTIPEHLMVDEHSLGATEWRTLLSDIRSFLETSEEKRSVLNRAARTH